MRQPGKVLYISGEDGAADTLKPRFRKQGGDESLFYVADGLIEDRADGRRHSRFLLTSLEPLEEALRNLRPDLVVIDPLQAFIGGKVDLHRANEVREALQGISKLAERYNFALLIICHLNKASQSCAMYRVLGSIDLVAGARSVLLAGRHRQDETYALVHLKCSVAQKGLTLLYSIDDAGLHWLGVDTTSGRHAQRVQPATKEDQCATPIKRFFVGWSETSKRSIRIWGEQRTYTGMRAGSRPFSACSAEAFGSPRTVAVVSTCK